MTNKKTKFDPFEHLLTEAEKQKFFNISVNETITLKKEYDDKGRERYKFLNNLFNSPPPQYPKEWVELFEKHESEKTDKK
jgi:hypothetical protein